MLGPRHDWAKEGLRDNAGSTRLDAIHLLSRLVLHCDSIGGSTAVTGLLTGITAGQWTRSHASNLAEAYSMKWKGRLARWEQILEKRTREEGQR
jgi:hypothetical protein